MVFKDLFLIFISKRMQKSPWVGLQRKYTQRRQAASLHQAAVRSRQDGPGGHTLEEELRLHQQALLPGAPAWATRGESPQAEGPSGPSGLGEVCFHCHRPGKHTRFLVPPPAPPAPAIVRVTVPQGSHSMPQGTS